MNKRCIVICNGPTVDDINKHRDLLDDSYIIAVNNYNSIFTKLKLKKPNALIVSPYTKIVKYDKSIDYYLVEEKNYRQNKVPNNVIKQCYFGDMEVYGQNVHFTSSLWLSGTYAIQLALQKEFDEIHIFGYDLTDEPDYASSKNRNNTPIDKKEKIKSFFISLGELNNKLTFYGTKRVNNYLLSNIVNTNYLKLDKCTIIIPARKGSKGFPQKNRYLFEYTANKVRNEDVIVTTDDEYIIEKAKDYGFKVHIRDYDLSNDTANIKDVLLDVIQNNDVKDNIMVLYLTYPDRLEKDIKQFYNTFFEKNCKSLLCLEPSVTHPYLTMTKNGNNWEQLIEHELYRRQDYPDVKEISHYLFMCNKNEIKKLNKRLFNNDTNWYELDKRVEDIDYEDDKYKKIDNTHKIIILGNDKYINNLDMNRLYKLKEEGYIIAGVNRIFQKFTPDILYFEDYVIYEELVERKMLPLKNCKVIMPEKAVIRRFRRNKQQVRIMLKSIKKHNVQIDVSQKHKKIPFRNSVAMLIRVLNDMYNKCEFYIYGVSLIFDKKQNHFWDDKNIIEKHQQLNSKEFYNVRLEKMYKDFRYMDNKENIKMYSIMNYNSRLNDFLEYRKEIL